MVVTQALNELKLYETKISKITGINTFFIIISNLVIEVTL